MGYAKAERELAAQGKGCLGKAADGEPIFILRGQDALAADLVERWAVEAQGVGCPWNKVLEAKRLAQAMREWSPQKNPD